MTRTEETVRMLVDYFGGPLDGPQYCWLDQVPCIGGVPLAGNHADPVVARLHATLALLVAFKLDCTVESFAFGKTGCDSNWHWFVPVNMNIGRCAYLDCLSDYGDACHLVENEHSDLHGNEKHSAWSTLPWLITGWAGRHSGWVTETMDRLGSPRRRTLERVTAGFIIPEAYSFSDNYWRDIQSIASILDR